MQENQHLIHSKGLFGEKSPVQGENIASMQTHPLRAVASNQRLCGKQITIAADSAGLDWTRRCTNRPEMSVFVHVSPLSSALIFAYILIKAEHEK